MTDQELEILLEKLSPEERRALVLAYDKYVSGWEPQAGTQEMAYYSKAEVIGFGGAAGGGKTSLLCGLALAPWHKRCEIIRSEIIQTSAIRDEIISILLKKGSKDIKPNRHGDITTKAQKISFTGLKDQRSADKAQGRAYDFKAFDEVTGIPEHHVRWSMNWNRSSDPEVKVQTLMTFNPPMSKDGAWVLDYFKPWVDKKVPYGEVLCVAVDEHGQDVFLDRKDPFVYYNGERVYDFDPSDFKETEIVRPKTRTFILSKITDNKYLLNTNYLSGLQSISDQAIKSALLEADMYACIRDGANQLFKSEWIKAAFDRYDAIKDLDKRKLCQMGVDVARGGYDKTAICPRYEGNIFGEIKTFQGAETATGMQVADIVLKHRKDKAIICIDTIGIGSSPFDMLTQHYHLKAYQDVIPVTVSKASGALAYNVMRIRNLRDELHHNLETLLNPDKGFNIAIKRDKDLLRELEAVERFVDDQKVYSVSSRGDMVEKLGRSPDKLTALLLSAMKVYDLRDYESKPIENTFQMFRR